MVTKTGPATADRLTDDMIAEYHAQGFLKVPQVLTPDEVTRFREASEQLIAREGAQVWGSSENELQVHYVDHAWLKDDTLRELVLHPVLTNLAKRLARSPLRVYGSDVLTKPPHRTLPTIIHDDEAGLPLSGLSNTLTAWVALVDVPVERGCLTYLPGSHLRPDANRQLHMATFADYRPLEELWPDFPWEPRVTVPLRSGDVSFHNYRTIHLAGTNDTDIARMGHGVVYMDDGAAYRPAVEDGHLAHLSPGSVLEGDRWPRI
ncbi:phytanoyl-CoA dioxygenase family protein [Micromonospora ureilytica]|uniref:phytanoyl-CoA dioxygenase family protein n=1 Tax=Micromonospora ureilytica TaxID=709868 RepID=UPI004039E299